MNRAHFTQVCRILEGQDQAGQGGGQRTIVRFLGQAIAHPATQLPPQIGQDGAIITQIGEKSGVGFDD